MSRVRDWSGGEGRTSISSPQPMVRSTDCSAKHKYNFENKIKRQIWKWDICMVNSSYLISFMYNMLFTCLLSCFRTPVLNGTVGQDYREWGCVHVLSVCRWWCWEENSFEWESHSWSWRATTCRNNRLLQQRSCLRQCLQQQQQLQRQCDVPKFIQFVF